MSLMEQIERLEYKLDLTLEILGAQPEWFPLATKLADDAGYETVDGLRKWCQNNIHPDYFKKFGRLWHIHRTKLPYIMKNGYNINAGSRHTKETVCQR